jgi:hypothetical protein
VFKKTGDVRPVVERRLAQHGLVTRITDDKTSFTVRNPDTPADAQLGAVSRLLIMSAKLEFCAEVQRSMGRCARRTPGSLCGRGGRARRNRHAWGASLALLGFERLRDGLYRP